MVFPDVNSCIGNFALETRGRGETEQDIVVDVETSIKMDDQVSFVIWFHRNGAIGTFHV